MIRRIDLRGSRLSPPREGTAGVGAYRDVVPRADTDVTATEGVVRPILDAVRHRGLEAVLELSARFDGGQLGDIPVPRGGLGGARRRLAPPVRGGLQGRAPRPRPPCRAQL